MAWTFVAVLGAIAAWRWATEPLAMLASLVALACAWLLAGQGRGRRLLPALALLAAGLAALRLFGPETAFPCQVACEGGAAFARIVGIDVLWIAGGGSLLLALLAWRRRHRPVDHATALLAWLLAGGTLAYLVLGWHLDLVCRHCLAMHTVVLAAVAGAAPTRLRWLLAITVAVLLAAGLLLTASALIPPRTVELRDPALIAARDRIDAARRHGAAEAITQIDLVLDLQCPICARRHRDWQRTATAVDGLTVTTRLLVRDTEPEMGTLARWVYASAHQGEAAFQLALTALLGSPAGSTAVELRPRLGEVVDVDALDRWLATHGPAVDALIADDQRLLIRLDAHRRTPTALLRQGDRVVERLSGDRDLTPLLERARGLHASPPPAPED